MTIPRISLAFLAFGALAAPTLAQTVPDLDDLDADRLNAEQVLIDFDYEGGACDLIGTPELGDNVDGTQSVTFTVTSTAEACTMQIVDHDIRWAIEADETVTALDVFLVGKTGEIVANGHERVDLD